MACRESYATTCRRYKAVSQKLNSNASKTMPRSPGDNQGIDYQLDDPEYPLVNGAVILVVRLRQIARG
jgi:hypothetical protein